uniref:Uncharacterized protein n=1 Tax=Romanomermis culicivorax TaxID=13658 RepID=A0A915K2D2_ROMCU
MDPKNERRAVYWNNYGTCLFRRNGTQSTEHDLGTEMQTIFGASRPDIILSTRFDPNANESSSNSRTDKFSSFFLHFLRQLPFSELFGASVDEQFVDIYIFTVTGTKTNNILVNDFAINDWVFFLYKIDFE